ncbi:copper resistance protein B [Salinibacter ruber]|jgi:copper resistance protein B|uniref:Copper resistance protein B n=1 Tax=Salinibacter ruber TaxID=146919 RepID=A0A9X2Q0U3_9BACT|nr:copper resistance protein B [Salinibacter ruber]MCS3676315.1 copper resistance protein B [Salinibacter ruber]MCS3679602.1 copper resistance protein B [Salinibacter ruber]MCS4178662.1 copper resistance protein B [Salinibacter ruber]
MMTRLKQPVFTYALSVLSAAILLAAAMMPLEARAQTTDDKIFAKVLFDQLEYVPEPAGQPIGMEAIGWVGGDVNRLWLRAEGEQSTLRREGETEIEALYGRLITPYFDFVAGARVDRAWEEAGKTRGHFAVGLQGVAPYRFEVEPTLYVSDAGNVSAEFTAAYGFQFTQRLILEPELETRIALQDVPEWGIGTGVNNLNLGLRLRYEFHRKFAPYIGYDQNWRFGETADFAGGDTSDGALVFGVRVWR